MILSPTLLSCPSDHQSGTPNAIERYARVIYTSSREKTQVYAAKTLSTPGRQRCRRYVEFWENLRGKRQYRYTRAVRI